jgi:phage I-like protein
MDGDKIIIMAALSREEGMFTAGLSAAIEPGDKNALPEDIQWMPPGKFTIHAAKGGKPWTGTVTVNESGAKRVADAFEALKAAGRRPYIDFNHDGAAAAGYVSAVRWGGDDPKKGGIRCTVQWSDRGGSAVQGREYGFFSPTFSVTKDGEVGGTFVNMGGLVNEPAFQEITPVTGKQGSETMNELLKALFAAGIIKAANATEEEAVAAVQAHDVAHKAQSGKITALEADLTSAKTKIEAADKRRAEGLVQQAVKDGKIAAKDSKTQSFYTNAILASGADAEEILSGLAVRPEFKTAVQGGEQRAQPEEGFEAQVKAKMAADSKIDFAEASAIAARENPESYKAYREAHRG